MIKPKKLIKGNTIGIIGPASLAPYNTIEQGVKCLSSMGYKVKLGNSCGKEWYSFSGEDSVRAADLNKMFADKNIDAIICMRGGYGCNRLIELIDFHCIINNPKLFIGYSDITTLHCAIEKFADLTTIHGPMLTSNFADNFDTFTKKSFLEIVEGKADYLINPLGVALKTLIPGSCTGKLAGGNLELAASTLGTHYSLNAKGKILFFEDLGEYTYKIDKMLYHMKHCNIFEDCAGVIFGSFKKCEKEKSQDFELPELLKLFFKDYRKPVIYNFQAGHCHPTGTIPLGVKCKLIANKHNASIKLLEQAVI